MQDGEVEVFRPRLHIYIHPIEAVAPVRARFAAQRKRGSQHRAAVLSERARV